MFGPCTSTPFCFFPCDLLKIPPQELEGLLQEDVPIDTKDSNGNTLLLLAAQQVRFNSSGVPGLNLRVVGQLKGLGLVVENRVEQEVE